ncbi:hypothetical protein [Ferviditalea candida]|uniref:Uncharacterized protein n=1 Tax=Ferviditalea candida TaxID=3108399 RepID=A0ABU5ZM13_9BACL|nr:hypothetical protein [Paenibacillaceae bacterium T2]
MQWGRPVSEQQEEIDLQVINALLGLGVSHSYWDNLDQTAANGDTKAALIIRNIGDFRLGCYFAFLVPVEDLPGKTERLSKGIVPFTLIGHIDKIVQNVVIY